MSSSTRSKKPTEDLDKHPTTHSNFVNAVRKVFYIPSELFSADTKLKLERFYHPGKGKLTLFMVYEQERKIMELLEFAEPRRSWLIDQTVCSNGKLYLTTPIDSTFLALHHLRKHCSQKALALDCIRDEQDDSVGRLLMTYIHPDQLKCIADVKSAGDDMTFYKYNANKAIAWLALKVRRVMEAFRRNDVHCGTSAVSQNYTKSELGEQSMQGVEVLRMACDFVGAYIDLEMHTELMHYLSLPTEQESREQLSKRKSLQALSGGENKKIKLDSTETVNENINNSPMDDSFSKSSGKSEMESKFTKTPLKERTLTVKEKAFAKSAKGSRSISSFFTR